MKIAVCFSGQPRFVKLASESIKKNLLNQSNAEVDVFGHLWFDDQLINHPYKYGGNWESQRIDSNAILDFQCLYSPRKLKVETSKSFKNSLLKTELCTKNGEVIKWTKHWTESTEPDYRNRMVNNWMSNFYSLLQASLLKKEYEFAHDFRYDFVVRCRTDTIIHQPIDFSRFDKNILYYTNTLNQPDEMIADYINIGSSKIMDVFMSSFAYIDYILEKSMISHNGAWCNEIVHKETLKLFNIASEGVPLIVSLPRF